MELQQTEEYKSLLIAIQIAPQHELGYLHLAKYYQSNQLSDEAIQALQAGIKQLPQSIPLRRNLAKLYGSTGAYQKALSYYEQWIQKKSEAWLFVDRGTLFLKLNQSEPAKKDFQEAIRLNPKSYEAHALLGMILARNREFEAALESLIQAAQYNKKQAELWFQISKLWRILEDWNKAESAVVRAIALKPEKFEYLQFHVLLMEASYPKNKPQSFEKATNSLETLLELFPERAWVLAHYGNFLWIQGKDSQVESYFLQALDKKKTFTWARVRLVEFYLEQNQNQKAESQLSLLIEERPELEWTYGRLALIKTLKQDFSGASEVLKKGLKTHPDSAVFYEILGGIQEKQELWNDALFSFQQISKKRPRDAGALSHQGMIYQELGDKAEAQKVILRSLMLSDNHLWGWFQYLLLLPQSKQEQWFGEQLQQIRPVLQSMTHRQLAKGLQKIQSLPQTLEQKMLMNLYHLLKGNAKAIAIPEAIKNADKTQLAPWILSLTARIYALHGEEKLSESYYQAVLQQLPKHTWTHARLGLLYSGKSQWERSNTHLKKFNQKFPHNAWVRFRLAINYSMQGKDEASIKNYKILIQDHPQYATALNNLAWTYLTSKKQNLRDIPKALELAQKAVNLAASVDHLDTLAEAFFQSGNTAKALKNIQRAMQLAKAEAKRLSYLKKQMQRFKQGNTQIPPPEL